MVAMWNALWLLCEMHCGCYVECTVVAMWNALWLLCEMHCGCYVEMKISCNKV